MPSKSGGPEQPDHRCKMVRASIHLLRRVAARRPWCRSQSAVPKPVAFDRWIEDVTPTLKPPVANKLLYGAESALKMMIVGGPNERLDYHVQAGEELFYMIKGDMRLDIVERKKFKSVHIPEGHMFILPSRVPHSPQRFADTIGLVLERGHVPSEIDGMRWYQSPPHADGAPATAVEYEEHFFCEDLGSQLGPVIERYRARPPGAAPTVTEDPPIAVDDDVEVGPVKDVRPLLAAARSGALKTTQMVMHGREYRCELLVGNCRGKIDGNVEKARVDTLLWHLAGDVAVGNAGESENAEKLRPGDVCLLPHGAPARIDRSGNGTCPTNATLVFTNNRANV
jgi:3-hydroxyanthranilate 3,4-dioxygenase